MVRKVQDVRRVELGELPLDRAEVHGDLEVSEGRVTGLKGLDHPGAVDEEQAICRLPEQEFYQVTADLPAETRPYRQLNVRVPQKHFENWPAVRSLD